MVLTSPSAASAAIFLLAGLPSLWGSRLRRKPSTAPGDEPIVGGVSEKVFLNVNGVRQGMFIEGRDVRNPVLLYLHGGMPEYFLTERYPTGLEECFTVVWWEQRGSGLSYSPNIPRETMTLEQMIADTVAVTNWVRQRFGQEQIYLMGHSGGSFIGIQVAARAPQLYRAYVGMAQMCDQLRSEKMAYEYMLRQFETRGNARMVRKLKAAPVTVEGGTPAPTSHCGTEPCTLSASARLMT